MKRWACMHWGWGCNTMVSIELRGGNIEREGLHPKGSAEEGRPPTEHNKPPDPACSVYSSTFLLCSADSLQGRCSGPPVCSQCLATQSCGFDRPLPPTFHLLYSLRSSAVNMPMVTRAVCVL